MEIRLDVILLSVLFVVTVWYIRSLIQEIRGETYDLYELTSQRGMIYLDTIRGRKMEDVILKHLKRVYDTNINHFKYKTHSEHNEFAMYYSVLSNHKIKYYTIVHRDLDKVIKK